MAGKKIEDYLKRKRVRPLNVRVTYHAYERVKERMGFEGSIEDLVKELNDCEGTIWRIGKKLFSTRMQGSFIVQKAMCGGYLCVTAYSEVIILSEMANKVQVRWGLCTELENAENRSD